MQTRMSPGRRRGLRRTALAAIIASLPCLMLAPPSAQAAAVTWAGGGGSNLWSDAGNWGGGLPMDGDDLTFGASARTMPVDDLGTLSLATNWRTLSLGTITFAAGAPAYQITISSVGSHVLALNGAGIVNGRTFITEGGSVAFRYGGQLQFFLGASAGTASIINNPATVDNAVSGITEFHNTSSAGSSTITNNGGFFSSQAHTQFFDSSSAGSSTITSHGALAANIANGTVIFSDNSTAGNATLIANGSSDPNFYGGYTSFGAHSNAGTATVIAKDRKSVV